MIHNHYVHMMAWGQELSNAVMNAIWTVVLYEIVSFDSLDFAYNRSKNQSPNQIKFVEYTFLFCCLQFRWHYDGITGDKILHAQFSPCHAIENVPDVIYIPSQILFSWFRVLHSFEDTHCFILNIWACCHLYENVFFCNFSKHVGSFWTI